MLKKVLFTMILCLLAASLISYAQDEDSQEDTSILFIGTVTDAPDEFVGLSIEGDAAILYICDGQADKNTISVATWFTGTVEDETLEMTRANGDHLVAALDEDAVTGQITFADGTTKEFALAPAEGDAALYRAEFAFGEDEFVGGWIVLPDGSSRGSVVKKDVEVMVPSALNAYNSVRDGTSNIKDGTSNTAK